MDIRRAGKIGKSWLVVIEKLWSQIAVAPGGKINA